MAVNAALGRGRGSQSRRFYPLDPKKREKKQTHGQAVHRLRPRARRRSAAADGESPRFSYLVGREGSAPDQPFFAWHSRTTKSASSGLVIVRQTDLASASASDLIRRGYVADHVWGHWCPHLLGRVPCIRQGTRRARMFA